jgi:hypothetical protein
MSDKKEPVLTELVDYEAKLAGIENRFKKTDGGIWIGDGDAERLSQYVMELISLLDSVLGEPNQYARQISSYYGHGLQNMYNLPSLKSVRDIISVVKAVQTHVKRPTTVFVGRPPVDVTREGVFFAGQTFDAMSAAARIFAIATKRLMLIDGYLGTDTLNILPTTGIALEILTKPPLAPHVKTLCQAFKAQHGSLVIKSSSAFHDRFVVIDSATVYHFGASIKDLRKKTFMFSLIEEPDIVAALQARIATEWGKAVTEV